MPTVKETNNLAQERPKYAQKVNADIYSSEAIYNLNANDILLGRGGNNNKYIGNERLRMMAMGRVDQYMALNKLGKSSMVMELLLAVRASDPPGRFLQRRSINNNSIDYDIWFEAGDKLARGKVAQVFRDAVCETRKDATKENLSIDDNSFLNERYNSRTTVVHDVRPATPPSTKNEKSIIDTACNMIDIKINNEIDFNDMDLKYSFFGGRIDPNHARHPSSESLEIFDRDFFQTIDTSPFPDYNLKHDLKVVSMEADHHSSTGSGRSKRTLNYTSPAFKIYRSTEHFSTSSSTASLESERTSIHSIRTSINTTQENFFYDKVYRDSSHFLPIHRYPSSSATTITTEIPEDIKSCDLEIFSDILDLDRFPVDFSSTDVADRDSLSPSYLLDVIKEDEDDPFFVTLLS